MRTIILLLLISVNGFGQYTTIDRQIEWAVKNCPGYWPESDVSSSHRLPKGYFDSVIRDVKTKFPWLRVPDTAAFKECKCKNDWIGDCPVIPLHRVTDSCNVAHYEHYCSNVSTGLFSNGDIPAEYIGITDYYPPNSLTAQANREALEAALKAVENEPLIDTAGTGRILWEGTDSIPEYKCRHKWVELHEDTIELLPYPMNVPAIGRFPAEYELSTPLICLICHQETRKVIHYKRDNNTFPYQLFNP